MMTKAPRNTILQGDVLERLRELPDGCVQCVVTSPPYWNLRDYGVPGQIGLEATPDEWLSRMVDVFAEVRRALRAEGWYLRADIVWAKPNPMPESVTDRPTRSHEYLFLFAKQSRYHYDADAIREPIRPKTLTTYGTKHRAQGNDALLVVCHERYDPHTPLYWRPLVGGGVCVVEGGQAG